MGGRRHGGRAEVIQSKYACELANLRACEGPKSSRVSMLASLRTCELATWRQYLNKFDRQLFAPWPRQNFVGWLSCVRLVHADALVLHPSDKDEAPRRQADSAVLHVPFKKRLCCLRLRCERHAPALKRLSFTTSLIIVGESLQQLSRRQSALRASDHAVVKSF